MRVSFESILPLRIILFIEIHSANTKTEDREEIYPRSILFHFTNTNPSASAREFNEILILTASLSMLAIP